MYFDSKNKYGLHPVERRSKPFKKKIVGFDIETEGTLNNFVLGCFYGDDIKKSFTTKEEIYTFINSSALRNYIVVATNLGFDFLGTLGNYRDKYKIIQRNGNIYKIKWYLNNKHIINFHDTLQYLKASVEQLGKILKIPKLPLPKSFGRLPHNLDEWQELRTYCYRDAEISYRFFKDILLTFINKNGLGMKCTIGSLSLDHFQRNYLKDYYFVAKPKYHDMIFPALYGGRTEVFKRGTFADVNCYDFNSLYPSVMLNRYPNPNKIRYQKKSNLTLILNYPGFSKVRVFMPAHYIPSLPFRQEDGKLIFPVMDFEGVYSHEELKYAVLNQGLQIKEYGYSIFYTEWCYPFKDYITDLYDKRLQEKERGDRLEVMTKLMMNSLFGKFAFKYQEDSEYLDFDTFDMNKLDKYDDYKFFPDIENPKFIQVTKLNQRTPTRYSFPEWSAYTTAYGRIKLHKMISKKELEDDVLYCDTDSIFLANGKTLPSSNLLGDLKLEYNSKIGIFTKPKMYFCGKIKMKGVKIKKDEHNINHYCNIMDNPSIVQDRFAKFRTVIRSRDDTKFGKLQFNQIYIVKKNLSLEDTKRWWHKPFNYHVQEDSCPIFL